MSNFATISWQRQATFWQNVNDIYIIQDQLAEMDLFKIWFQWEYTNVHRKGLSTVFKIHCMPADRSFTQSWRYGFFNCNYYNLSYWQTFIFNRRTSQKSFCFPVGRDESSRSVSYADTILTTFMYMILVSKFYSLCTTMEAVTLNWTRKLSKKLIPHLWMKYWLKCNRWLKNMPCALGAVQLN